MSKPMIPVSGVYGSTDHSNTRLNILHPDENSDVFTSHASIHSTWIESRAAKVSGLVLCAVCLASVFLVSFKKHSEGMTGPITAASGNLESFQTMPSSFRELPSVEGLWGGSHDSNPEVKHSIPVRVHPVPTPIPTSPHPLPTTARPSISPTRTPISQEDIPGDQKKTPEEDDVFLEAVAEIAGGDNSSIFGTNDTLSDHILHDKKTPEEDDVFLEAIAVIAGGSDSTVFGTNDTRSDHILHDKNTPAEDDVFFEAVAEIAGGSDSTVFGTNDTQSNQIPRPDAGTFNGDEMSQLVTKRTMKVERATYAKSVSSDEIPFGIDVHDSYGRQVIPTNAGGIEEMTLVEPDRTTTLTVVEEEPVFLEDAGTGMNNYKSRWDWTINFTENSSSGEDTVLRETTTGATLEYAFTQVGRAYTVTAREKTGSSYRTALLNVFCKIQSSAD